MNFQWLIITGLLSAGLPGSARAQTPSQSMARLPLADARSSSLLEPGWDPDKVIDGWYKAPWFSSLPCRSGEPEWLSVELAKAQPVGRIVLWPRYTGRDRKPLGLCFPRSFVLQASQDGETWSDLPGTSVKNYRTPGDWQGAEFVLAKPVEARFIRLFVTACGLDENSGSFLQLAEFEEFGPGSAEAVPSSPAPPQTSLVQSPYPEAPRIKAEASSVIWRPAALIDGWNDNPWFSTRAARDGQAEWASVELASVVPVRQIVLTPRFLPLEGRPVSVGFPVDFELQGSLDGHTWQTLPGQNIRDYPRPAKLTGEVFTLSEAAGIRFVRLLVTRFGSDSPAGSGRGGKYLQLSEFWVFQDSGKP